MYRQSREPINIYTLHSSTSKNYKDASKPPVRAVERKKPSSQTLPILKKKPRSVGSAASSSGKSISFDMAEDVTPCADVKQELTSSEHENQSTVLQNVQDDKTESILESKRQEFLILRKEFIDRQNEYIDQYAQLRDLEVQLGAATGAAGEIQVLSITDWPVHDLLLLAEGTPTQEHTEIRGILGPKILQQLTVQLTGVREQVLNMGTELMRRRLEILKCIRAIQHNQNMVFVYEGNNIQWKTKNAEFDAETVKLRELVLGTVKDVEAKLTYSLDAAKIPWMDRDNMIKKIERLQKELAAYKTSTPGAIQPENLNEQKKVLEELHKERAIRANLKDMLAGAEERASAARARIVELERQLTSASARSKWATAPNHKPLHSNRHGSCHDAMSRKSVEKETNKTKEISIEVLSRQRDSLQIRILELQEEAAVILQEAGERETQMMSRVESLMSKMEDQERQKELAETRAQEMENRLINFQAQYNKLKKDSQELLLEMQHVKCLDYLPQKAQFASQDFDILCDLKTTKDALARMRTELERSRKEKNELVKSLAMIAQGRPNSEIIEELLKKEEENTDLRREIDKLTENNSLMEQSIKYLENQIVSLRSEVTLMRNFNEYQSSNLDIPREELEKQVYDLCLRVKQLTMERAALASEAATRALMLERHERCAELFAQVVRARRALAAHLDCSSDSHSLLTGASNPEVSQAMSKACESSANTWSALRAERECVRRLERVVLAQTEQLAREGALRVQQDRRRAQLERDLIRAWAGGAARPSCERTITVDACASEPLHDT